VAARSRRLARAAGTLALYALLFGATLTLVGLASYWAARRALQLDPPAPGGPPHAVRARAVGPSPLD
jgi:hypothetical protein